MERWAHKVLALFVVLVVIFIFTALPIAVSGFFHKRGPRGYRFLTIVNCFGGGVFFGAYLMHMTPEVKDLLTEAWLIPNNIQFPMAELFMGAGFFLLMFVEKGVFTLITKYVPKGQEAPQSTEIGVKVNTTGSIQAYSQEVPEETNDNTIGRIHMHGSQFQDGGLSGNAAHKYKQVYAIEDGKENQGENDEIQDLNSPNGGLDNATHKYKQVYTIEDSITAHPTTISDSAVSDTQDSNATPPLVPESKGNTLQSLILLAALSLDSVFEGMSLGLQRTPTGVWNLVFAILSHEVVIAFTLGLELFKVNSAKKTFLYAVFYAFTAPFGITIGTTIMETGRPSPTIDIVSGIFQAMSAGVFIYCTFLEVLPGQIGHNAKLANLIAVFLGFAFMSVMALIPDGQGEDPSPLTTPPTFSYAINTTWPL